ncbi:hypothetical protein [Streptomyces sp. NPDC056296]|uniref:hypothetical protein n=1 Tax=Streptomyces sp. NPDC056296 TaxID=3345775 RepID=UPI0035D54E4E
MIWSAVLPGAALRMLRTVAGRRALHVALLVGGLFVLGILCGERAQAAEGVPSVRDAIGQVVDVPADVPTERPREGREPTVPQDSRTGQTGQESGAAAQDSRAAQRSGAVLSELRPVAEDVVRSVEARVVRPVGDAVETVADGLGAVAQTEVPPLEALPPLPSPPSLNTPSLTSPTRPSLPSSPSLPFLPDPAGMADVPGRLMPVGTDPRPGPSTTVPDTSDAADTSVAFDARPSDGAGVAAHVAYGPETVGGGSPAAAHVDTHRAVPAPTEHAPAHRAPTGDPDGTLGTGAGADHGTPRHGDAHAVTPHHRIPFRLVPGAFAHADAAETRDRYRDIPVSPA